METLRGGACMADAFGPFFVDYFARLKEAEIKRFLSKITEWEHKEYFALL